MLLVPLFRAEFKNDVTPPQLLLTNLTSIADVVAGTCLAMFKLTGPDGVVFYENAGYATGNFVDHVADMNFYPIGGLDYNPDFDTALPVDILGKILQGNYTLEIKVTNYEGVPGYEVAYLKKTFNYCHTQATVSLEHTLDTFCSWIKSNDESNYSSAEGDYTLSLVRIHKLFPPAALEQAETVVDAPEIILTPIYTGTYTTTLETIATYEFADDIFIIDKLTGSLESQANWDANLCEIYCGLKKLNGRYIVAMARNPLKAKEYEEQINRITALISMFAQAQKCGKTADANDYLAAIYDVGAFEEGCGCDGDVTASTLIVPTCGGLPGVTNVNVLGNAGYGTQVIQSLVGDTQTFTVQLSPTYKNKIDLLKNVYVETSTPAEIEINETISGNDKTYEINFIGTLVAALVDGSVTTAKLADLAVEEDKIAEGAVSTVKIADGSVTTIKLAIEAVTEGKISTGAVTSGKIADSAVTTAKINAGAVNTDRLADSAATTAKIADTAVTEAKIAASAITTSKIAALAVTGAKVALATLDSTHLTDAYNTNDIIITRGADEDSLGATEHVLQGGYVIMGVEWVVTQTIEGTDPFVIELFANLASLGAAISIPTATAVGTKATVAVPALPVPPMGNIGVTTTRLTPADPLNKGRVDIIFHIKKM